MTQKAISEKSCRVFGNSLSWVSMSVLCSAMKPQFGPWLLQQVLSGQYDGLYMIDKDRFRVPWKHNSRKDCGDEDNKIFREWAVVSGKINEYPNDKAKWKTNFRCALYSLKQFEMVQDNSKDSEDPHKIYRIVHPEHHHESQNIHIDSLYNSANNGAVELMEHDDLQNHMETLCLNQYYTGMQPRSPYSQQPLSNSCNYFANQLPFVLQPCMQNNIPVAVTELTQPAYHPPPLSDNLPSLYELEISIHYRKKEMLKVQSSAQHVQLHYQHDFCTLSCHSVCFPNTEELFDHKQIQYTKRILESIQRGLLLEVSPAGICGLRQDKCNVFVSTIDPAEIKDPQPRKIPQDYKMMLFSYEKYKKDLKDFKENRCGSPDYTIYLCFGEKFPDGKALEKKLIVVKVVPLICRELHKKAQMEGASSLQNDVSLQISHNSLYELIDSTFCLPAAE